MLNMADKSCHNRPPVADVMRKQARQKLEDMSIHPINPDLNDFLFAGATPYQDMYVLYSVKLMHILHLRVSKMLKEADAERLKSISHTAHHYKTMERTTRTFDSLRTDQLRKISKFVE